MANDTLTTPADAGSDTILIIGVIGGIGGAVVLIVICVCCLIVKRKKTDKPLNVGLLNFQGDVSTAKVKSSKESTVAGQDGTTVAESKTKSKVSKRGDKSAGGEPTYESLRDHQKTDTAAATVAGAATTPLSMPTQAAKEDKDKYLSMPQKVGSTMKVSKMGGPSTTQLSLPSKNTTRAELTKVGGASKKALSLPKILQTTSSPEGGKVGAVSPSSKIGSSSKVTASPTSKV